MELETLMAKINLKNTCLKLEISLHEIKTKNPKRTDLITSMQQSLNEVRQAILVLEELERELRSSKQMNFNLEKLNLELKFKNKDLQTQLKINKF